MRPMRPNPLIPIFVASTFGENILDARVWPLKGFTSSYGFGRFVGRAKRCKKQAMLDEGD